MTNKLLTSVAAGAILLGASIAPAAFAQDTTQPSTTLEDPATTPGATPDAGSADMPDLAPSDNTADTMTPAPGDTAATTDSGYISAQSPEQISANTYIGQSLYNSADESIGRINDLILEQHGGIAAAVVGVGGFLGIGEKWVAVPFETISISHTPDTGDVKLTTTETAESLQAAPEFKTTAQQIADRNAAVDGATTSSTTMEPAPAPVE